MNKYAFTFQKLCLFCFTNDYDFRQNYMVLAEKFPSEHVGVYPLLFFLQYLHLPLFNTLMILLNLNISLLVCVVLSLGFVFHIRIL